jgi:hypothetical protein
MEETEVIRATKLLPHDAGTQVEKSTVNARPEGHRQRQLVKRVKINLRRNMRRDEILTKVLELESCTHCERIIRNIVATGIEQDVMSQRWVAQSLCLLFMSCPWQ